MHPKILLAWSGYLRDFASNDGEIMVKYSINKRQCGAVALFCSVILTFALPAISWGQANTPSCLSPQPSDTAFAPYNPNGTGILGFSGQLSTLSDPPTAGQGASWYITRVVGPGTPGEFNPVDGTLANWSTYTANGILSEKAYIQVYVLLGADGGNPGPGHVLVPYVNGNQDAAFPLVWTPVTPGVPGAQEPTDVCGAEILILNAQVPISTRYLKFPQRAPNGSTPTPVLNQIAFASDSGFLTVEVGTLSFQAMSPIILVHGINAGGAWFPNNQFTRPLDAAKAPYAIAIKPLSSSLAPADIYTTGEILMSVIPPLANEFGARKVHIVAHSKGGLWSRYFLAGPGSPYSRNVSAPPTPQNFGALSLTTLDTPHHGAFLADILVNSGLLRLFQVGVATGLLQTNPADVNTLFDFVNQLAPQLADLTRDQVELFNGNYPGGLPSLFEDVDGQIYGTAYNAVAADGDIGDKTNSLGMRYVDATDCAGFPVPAVCPLLYQVAGAENEFTFAAQLTLTGLWTLGPYVAPIFNPNDVVVTQQSARYNLIPQAPGAFNLPFNLILDPVRKNHSTVGDACVSGGAAFFDLTGAPCRTTMGVLNAIQQLQPVN
jgi:hypothetical protein